MPLSLEYGRLVENVLRESGGEWSPSATFDDGMQILLREVQLRNRLHREGRRLLQHEVLRIIRQRLLLDTLVRHTPAMEQRALRVLLITGMPRTKSTLLHNLLADVGAFSWVSYAQALEPFPWPRSTADEERVVARASAHLRVLRKMSPDLLRIHPMREDRPEECITLMQLTGRSDRFTISLTVPEYREWAAQPSIAALAYAEYFQILERIVPLSRPIVLKAPTHAPYVNLIEGLSESVRCLWLQRDATEVDRSFRELVTACRTVFEADSDTSDWASAWSALSIPACAEVCAWTQVESVACEIAAESRRPAPHPKDYEPWLAPRGAVS